MAGARDQHIGLKPGLRGRLGGERRPAGADLQWTINAYLLPLTALLLLGGALGDRFGPARLLTLGVALFAVTSAGCAAAPDLHWLLAARVLQGVAAALVLPNSLAILGAAYQDAARARAIGVWAAASATSAALGPVLGGWLIDAGSWRAIFLINLPLAAAAILFVLAGVRDPKTGKPQASLDLAGALLAAAGLGGLVWGLTIASGPAGWTMMAVALLIGGLVLLAGFLRVEFTRGDRAMAPPALLASRQVMALNLMTFLLYAALGGFLVLLPYLLITASGYSATAAGAALLPFPVVMALGGPIMGALAGRFGSRPLLVAGSAIVAAGFALALRIDRTGAYATTVLPCVLVVALGMAGAAAPLTNAVLSGVDARHRGAASGLNSAVARAGGLGATAMLGTVLAAAGDQLVSAFHGAALVGAGLALAAALSAWQAQQHKV